MDESLNDTDKGTNGLDNLTNENYYGIVYSACCQTAAYDDLDIGNYPGRSLVEGYLFFSNKGGTAYIGNTRSASSGYNGIDVMQERFYRIIFSNPDNLNRNYCGGVAQNSTRIVGITHSNKIPNNYFGDPSMPIWTDRPSSLSPINPTITYNANSVSISNVSTSALIGVSSYDFSYQDRKTGVTQVTFNTSTRPLFIVITEKNKLPYIAVTGGTLAQNQTWGEEFRYINVLGDITIPGGYTLTVKSGTKVNFAANKGIYLSGSALSTYGTLSVEGNVVFSKITGGSNWSGISIDSYGRMNVSGDISIEYAGNGISIYDSSGLSSGSNKITISNCTSSGVYVGYCSPTLNKLSISSVTTGYGGICVVGNTSAPVIHDSDILSSVMGIQVGNYADASAYLCDIKTNTYDCIYLGTAANLLLNGDGGYGHNTIDPATNQKAINNNATNGSITAENNYWGETPSGSLFGYAAYVDYDPYLSSAYSGVGTGKKVLADSGTSFISAYQLENQNRWMEAAAMYKTLQTVSISPQDKRWAIKSLLRSEDNSGKEYAAVEMLVQEELASIDTKGQYRVFLDQFLCELELRQGNIDQAISGFLSTAEKYCGTPVEVDMLARAAEVYGRQLGDKSKAREYADQAAAINPGQLSLYGAYRASGTDYDPSQYEDLFAGKENAFGNPPEPNEPVSDTKEYVSVAPNPANPITTISYSIKNPSNVRLSIYSINGQKVATLVDGPMSAGAHSVAFNGLKYASGVYFFRFESIGFVKTGKMLLLK
jgi:hypothetical protein